MSKSKPSHHMNVVQKLSKDNLRLDQYSKILENIENGSWLINDQYEITFVNLNFAKILDYSIEEMINKKIYDFIDASQADVFKKKLDKNGFRVDEQFELIFRKKDRSKVWTLTTLSPLFDENNNYYGSLGLIINISALKKAEALLSAQRQTFEILLKDDTIDSALSTLTKSIEYLENDTMASILILDPEGKQFQTVIAPNQPESYNQTIKAAGIGPYDGSCGASAYFKKFIVVSDIQSDPIWSHNKFVANAHDFKACWANPIISHDGSLLGVFALTFREIRSPKDAEIDLIKNFTAVSALAIEHVRNKSALAKTVSLLNSAIESTADGILVVALDGTVSSYNQKFLQMWQLSESHVKFKADEQILKHVCVLLKDPEWFLTRVDNIYSDPEKSDFDVLEFKDGTILERYTIPQRLENKVIGRVWSFRDVTEERKTEVQLKESEQNFKAIADATYEGIVLSRNAQIELVNESLLKIYGYTKDEVIGKNVVFLAAPEFQETVSSHSKRNIEINYAKRNIELSYEAQGIKKDGTRFWGEIRGRNILYKGSPARITSIRDITERKITEERLRQSEETFRTTFDVAAVGNVQVDPVNRKITNSNKKFCEITGYSNDELIGKTILDLTYAEDVKFVKPIVEDFFNGKMNSCNLETRFVKKDETIIWSEVSFSSVSDCDGNTTNSIWVFQDITAKKIAEEQRDLLIEKEKKALEQATFLANAAKVLGSSLDYEITLKNIADLIASTLADWCYVALLKDELLLSVATSAKPDKLEQVHKLDSYCPNIMAPEGLPKAIRLGKPVLYPEVNKEQLTPSPDRWPIIGTNDPYYLDVISKLGLTSYMVLPMFVREKVIGGMLIASSNPSRHFTESDLVLANELAHSCAVAIDNASLYREAQKSIQVRDDFISIASHELRTPLTPLIMQIQLLKKYLEKNREKIDPEFLHYLIRNSEQESQRMVKLVENLLDVSRIRAGRFVLSLEELNLMELVRSTVQRLWTTPEPPKSSINITGNPDVQGFWDKTRLEQVITNLLSNAIKYGQGNPIQVNIDQVGNNAIIDVIDQGIGIDIQDQKKIFSRFERAVDFKSFGGLGLGLYISKEIVEAHGGTIKIVSESGKGSDFTVILPFRNLPNVNF